MKTTNLLQSRVRLFQGSRVRRSTPSLPSPNEARGPQNCRTGGRAYDQATTQRLECAVGGEDRAWAWAKVLRGVSPLMERFGITTATELQADALAERLQAEFSAANGIVIVSNPSVNEATVATYSGRQTHAPIIGGDNLKEAKALLNELAS
jgi:hypothetical protein